MHSVVCSEKDEKARHNQSLTRRPNVGEESLCVCPYCSATAAAIVWHSSKLSVMLLLDAAVSECWQCGRVCGMASTAATSRAATVATLKSAINSNDRGWCFVALLPIATRPIVLFSKGNRFHFATFFLTNNQLNPLCFLIVVVVDNSTPTFCGVIHHCSTMSRS